VPIAYTTHAVAAASTVAIIRSTLELLAVTSSKRVMERALMTGHDTPRSGLRHHQALPQRQRHRSS
jgi:hypothetical protein